MRLLPTLVSVLAVATAAGADLPITFTGTSGPGLGKHLVFVLGDDEYRSEEGMPQIARLLAVRHGFTCTVLFPIQAATGQIDSRVKDNIPGLETLARADGMLIFARFRCLPDDQMRHLMAFTDAGRGLIGLRTATHAFQYPKQSTSPYRNMSSDCTEPGHEGGFGREILGETWLAHHGKHKVQSSLCLIAPGAEGSPLLRGIADAEIWSTSDVYRVRLPPTAQPLLLGRVLAGMHREDPPAPAVKDVDPNQPMMPVAWTWSYTGPSGRASRVFTSTFGGALAGRQDIAEEGYRRLLVNAAYWIVGLEDRIPAKADVTLAGAAGFRNGVRPQDVVIEPVP